VRLRLAKTLSNRGVGASGAERCLPDLIWRNLRQTLRIESGITSSEEVEVSPGFFGIKCSVEKPKIQVITTVVAIVLELLDKDLIRFFHLCCAPLSGARLTLGGSASQRVE
jgi:hypothetical protein